MPRPRFELANCPLCGEIADIDTSGPMGYGQVFESCRNQHCLLSAPHPCRPDPSAPPAHDPKPWETGEYRSPTAAAQIAAHRLQRVRREAARIARGTELGIAVHFMSIGR